MTTSTAPKTLVEYIKSLAGTQVEIELPSGHKQTGILQVHGDYVELRPHVMAFAIAHIARIGPVGTVRRVSQSSDQV